jgi:hypothetical protein
MYHAVTQKLRTWISWAVDFIVVAVYCSVTPLFIINADAAAGANARAWRARLADAFAIIDQHTIFVGVFATSTLKVLAFLNCTICACAFLAILACEGSFNLIFNIVIYARAFVFGNASFAVP